MSFSIRAKHHVVDKVHASHKSHAESVLGDERKSDAEISDLDGRFRSQIHFLFVLFGIEVSYIAVFKFDKSCDGFEHFFLTATRDTRNAEDFTRIEIERHVLKRVHTLSVFASEVFDGDTFFRIVRKRSVDFELHFLTDHHFGELLLVRFGSIDGCDMFALAQDRAAICNRHNLVEFVRDDDNRLSVLSHLAQNVEQLFDFLRSQNCRRLVKNKNIRTSIQHFDDFDGLFFGNGQIVDFSRQIEVKSVFIHDFLKFFRSVSLQIVEFDICAERPKRQRDIFQPRQKFRFGVVVGFVFNFIGFALEVELEFFAQDDIVARRKQIHELEMLVNHTYFVFKGVDRRFYDHFFSVHEDLTFVREVNACEHIHQRGLAAAVFAENGKYFAFTHVEIDVCVCDDASESLRNVFHFNNDFAHCMSSEKRVKAPVGAKSRKLIG